MTKPGRPMIYHPFVVRLRDDLLYDPATIVREAAENGVFLKVESEHFARAPKVEKRKLARSALQSLAANNLPSEPDGKIPRRQGGHFYKAWYGWRWKLAIRSDFFSDEELASLKAMETAHERRQRLAKAAMPGPVHAWWRNMSARHPFVQKGLMISVPVGLFLILALFVSLRTGQHISTPSDRVTGQISEFVDWKHVFRRQAALNQRPFNPGFSDYRYLFASKYEFLPTLIGREVVNESERTFPFVPQYQMVRAYIGMAPTSP